MIRTGEGSKAILFVLPIEVIRKALIVSLKDFLLAVLSVGGSFLLSDFLDI